MAARGLLLELLEGRLGDRGQRLAGQARELLLDPHAPRGDEALLPAHAWLVLRFAHHVGDDLHELLAEYRGSAATCTGSHGHRLGIEVVVRHVDRTAARRGDSAPSARSRFETLPRSRASRSRSATGSRRRGASSPERSTTRGARSARGSNSFDSQAPRAGVRQVGEGADLVEQTRIQSSDELFLRLSSSSFFGVGKSRAEQVARGGFRPCRFAPARAGYVVQNSGGAR